jgi:protein ImuB
LLAAVLQKGQGSKDRVCACTPAAQARGVTPGMLRSTVLGLVADIVLANDDAQARQRHLRDTALGLLQYTPNVAFFEDQSLLLEVSASLSLFNGPRGLWRRIQATLKNMDVHACAGMAPTAQGAWILASHTACRRRRVLDKEALARQLDPLPASALPAARPYTDWLSGIGCTTLKQLRQLPREGLQQRSSPLLVQALDAAYGDAEDYFTWYEAPETFSQHYDLIERLEHVNAVLAVAERLIEQLCGWLQTRQCAVSQCVLLLHHEKGRHARPPTSIVLRLSEAAWRPEDFLGVLREQLQATTLSAPVIALDLSIAQAAPRPVASASLFPEPAQWLRQEHRLLDLLRARLGEQRILHARPCADYRPEQANRWQPANDAPDAPGAPAAGAPPYQDEHARPFWLLPHPVELDVQGNRPVYNGHPLRLIQGPERLESGWWNAQGHERRDYFIAQGRNGIRYWVYQERESLDSRWFLQGLFA